MRPPCITKDKTKKTTSASSFDVMRNFDPLGTGFGRSIMGYLFSPHSESDFFYPSKTEEAKLPWQNFTQKGKWHMGLSYSNLTKFCGFPNPGSDD